jgi:endonuclease/exonuclease/phosphatase family metal-dependent hydrolase
MARKSTSILANLLFWVNWLPGILMLFSALALIIKPQWSSVIAISGLAYPVLLGWEILMVIIFLFLLSKKIWQPLSFVLISWFSFSSFISFGDNTVPLDKSSLISVSTWNVRFFDSSFHEEGYDLESEAYQLIRSTQSDIMAFQEYRSRPDLKLESTFKYLKEAGNFAIGSNFPLGQSGHYRFDEEISYGGNGFQWADISIGGKYYRFYNIHLSSIRLSRSELDLVDKPSEIKDQEELKGRSRKLYQLLKQAFYFRQQQQNVLLDHMESSPFPVILMGDINDSPNSYSARVFRKKFKDSWFESGKGVGKTYVHPILPYRIDYIYLPENIQSFRSKVFKSNLSDHHLLNTHLRIPGG